MPTHVNPDDLIQGIRSILARNRSSLSDTDVVLLEQTIKALERLPTVPDPSDRKAQLGIIAKNLLKVFSAVRVIKLLKEFFEENQDLI
jgi:hypothetical protein